MMGRIACFVGAETLKGFKGWTGVPNAGEDEGIAEDGGAGVLAAKMLAIGICLRLGDIDGGGSMIETLLGGLNRMEITVYQGRRSSSEWWLSQLLRSIR